MAEIRATLRLESLGREIKVNMLNTGISQHHNNRGLPISGPSSIGIHFRINSIKDADLFHEWAKEKLLKESGEFVFYDAFAQKVSHRICFQKAACSRFRILFNRHSDQSFMYEVSLSVNSKFKEIKLGPPPPLAWSIIEKPLPEIEPAAAPQKPEFVSIEIEEKDGLPKQDYRVGDTFVLVINTKGKEGKIFEIDFSDEISLLKEQKAQLKFGEKALINNILPHTIESENDRIELKVVPTS